MGYSGNMRKRYTQRIVLPQSVFALPTSVAGFADYYANQFLCNTSRGLKQSFLILRFDPLLNCLFDDPLSLLSNNLLYLNFECREDVVLVYECFSV